MNTLQIFGYSSYLQSGQHHSNLNLLIRDKNIKLLTVMSGVTIWKSIILHSEDSGQSN